METLSAILTHVKFFKDGFFIGVFKGDAAEQTCLGNMIKPEIGVQYKLFGKWVHDPKWGKQFRFTSYDTCMPKDTDSIIRYLTKTAKWVRKKTAQKIVAMFGPDTLNILRNHPLQVASEIKGISLARAYQIQENIKANETIEAALVNTEKLVGGIGLRKSLPVELVTKWGSDAPEIVEKDPYVLTEFKGIGFRSADIVALRIGYDPQSINRQAAAVLHILKQNASNGNVWLSIENLLSKGLNLIGCSVKQGLAEILKRKLVIQDDSFLALTSISSDEFYIAAKLKTLMDQPDGPRKENNFDR